MVLGNWGDEAFPFAGERYALIVRARAAVATLMFRACVAGSVRSLDASALPRHSTISGMQAMRKINLNLL